MAVRPGELAIISPGPDNRIYPVAKLAAILDVLADEGVAVEQALSGTGIPAAALDRPKRASR